MAKQAEIWRSPFYILDGGKRVKVGEITMEYLNGAVRELSSSLAIPPEEWEAYKKRMSRNISRAMSH